MFCDTYTQRQKKALRHFSGKKNRKWRSALLPGGDVWGNRLGADDWPRCPQSDEDGEYLWTHKRFDIGVNDGRIVDVNLTSESKVGEGSPSAESLPAGSDDGCRVPQLSGLPVPSTGASVTVVKRERNELYISINEYTEDIGGNWPKSTRHKKIPIIIKGLRETGNAETSSF